MYKLEKLSGLEQKLYFLLEAEGRKVVDSGTAMKLLGISRMHAYNLLNSMLEKGALDRVKSNLYVRIPAHIVHDRGKYAEDPVLVGKHLADPYFFSYYTALSLHGLSQQHANRYYLSTTARAPEVNYHGNVIQPVILREKRFFGFESMEYRDEEVRVSDLERTIVDVMNRPEYAGGYEEILRCFLGLEGVDWKRLSGYLDRMGEKILLNRTGFVFDLLGDTVGTPVSFLEGLRNKLSGNVYYFERNRKGEYERKWRIVVDPRLKKILEGA